MSTLTAIVQLTDQVRTQAARIAELEAERDQACKLVAEMHAAATGYIQGPKRGVVEDVADLAAERDQLRAEVERLRKPMMEEHIAQAVRPLYKDAQSAAMGLLDDIATTRAIEAAKEA